MELYEIHSIPIAKENRITHSGLHGISPYQINIKAYIYHKASHTISISGPYMDQIICFGKGNVIFAKLKVPLPVLLQTQTCVKVEKRLSRQ